jgi:Eukaryotic protein of unknown function (DUF829)
VVLAGWLGCRVPQLKHYEAMYQSLGFDTFPLVVPTLAVIDRSLQQQSPSIIVPADLLSWQQPPIPPPRQSTVQDWALYTLQTIHNRQPPYYLFHVFSNGGCFLWESVCHILDSRSAVQEEKELQKQLASKCRGVVFDSCPAWMGSDPSGLWKALQHCSTEDRQEAIAVYGQDCLQYVDARQRNHDYFHYLTTNKAVDVPQLYLYSRDDPLSDAAHIDPLIQKRQRNQTQPVLKQAWDQSVHCGHLRQHPDEYREAIVRLVQLATQQSRL